VSLQVRGRIFMDSLTKRRSSNFVLLGYIAVTGAAMLSGLIPSLSKPALQGINPLFFTAIVTLAPAIVFTPASMRRTDENKHIKKWGFVILTLTALAGTLVAPYIYFLGLLQTQATDAALLANGEMIFTVAFASLFFGERLSRKGLFAMTLIAFGIIVAITDFNFSTSLLNITAPGHLLILGATFLWGLDNNVTSAIADRVIVARIVQLKALISGAGLLLIGLLVHALNFTSLGGLLYVLLLGLIVFSGSAFLSIQSLKRLGAIRTTIMFPISSVFGLIFAFVLLHEPITFYQVCSVGIIVVGIDLLTSKNSVIREGMTLEQY